MKNLFLNHLLSILNQNSSPAALGTPQSALYIALFFTVIILFAYLLVDKLPRFKKNNVTKQNEPKIIKAMIVLAAGAQIAASMDAWWHVAIGRDSFWVLPHVIMYGSVAFAALLSFYTWLHTRDVQWKHIFFALMIFPIAGVFDNYWHLVFGSENLANPKMMPWSPPHLLLIVGALIAVIHLKVILHKYQKTEDFNFFGNLCLGIIATLFLAITMPFHPTEGWGQVAGFAGAGVLAFMFIAISLVAQKTLKGGVNATFTAIFMVLGFIISYGKEVAPQIIVLPHDRPPIWLFVLAYLTTAVLLDITKNHFPLWVKGMIAGSFWAAILFGFSSQYMQPQFQYGMTEIFTAVAFSAMGGLVAGSIFGLFHLDDAKHIEKLLKKW